MSSPKHPFRGDHCAALVDLSILLLMCSWTDVPNLADTKAFAVAKAIGMSSFRCSLKGLFTSSLKTPAPAAVASSACSARFRLTLARLSVGSSGRTAASILRVRASLVRKALATLLLPVEIVFGLQRFSCPSAGCSLAELAVHQRREVQELRLRCGARFPPPHPGVLEH